MMIVVLSCGGVRRLSMCCGAALLLLSSCVFKEPEVRAVHLAQTQTGLQRIGRAITEYRKVNGTMPPVSVGGLSWRVHLLPFLGESDLHGEFHLDEPWDSDNNVRLISRMPQVYAALMEKGTPCRGRTSFLAVIGEGTLWGDVRASSSDLLNQTDQGAIIVQVDPSAAIIWTQPNEWVYHPHDSVEDLYVHPTADAFYVVTLAGTVKRVSASLERQACKRLFVRGDWEPLGSGKAPVKTGGK